MTTWSKDELDEIGRAEELQIAPRRRDGILSGSPGLRPDPRWRTPVTIGVVRQGDDLSVRSYRGRGGAWFRAAQVRHEGRIWTGDVEKDVTFEDETDPSINDQIDSAYRAKYRRSSSYVPPMLSPEARATTLKLVPRSPRS